MFYYKREHSLYTRTHIYNIIVTDRVKLFFYLINTVKELIFGESILIFMILTFSKILRKLAKSFFFELPGFHLKELILSEFIINIRIFNPLPLMLNFQKLLAIFIFLLDL